MYPVSKPGRVVTARVILALTPSPQTYRLAEPYPLPEPYPYSYRTPNPNPNRNQVLAILCGVIFMSMPITIVGNNFTSAIEEKVEC